MKVSPEIENLIPYKPGQPISEIQREYGLNQVFKLASNETPYGPSPKVIEALKAELPYLNRYPDSNAYEISQVFSKHYGVRPENLVFGNGSNELIDLLIRVFCAPGQSLLTSEIAFVAYKICARAARVKVIETPMINMGFDLEAMKTQMKKNPARIVFIANPNNPTGTYLNTNELSNFLNFMDSYPETLVALDEAYTEFVRAKDYPKSLELFHQHPNLVILRTLSKVYGLAGIRLGTLIASPEVTGYVHRVRNPFNVNQLAQVAGVAALSDLHYVNQLCEFIWSGLDYFYRELQKLGIKYWESQANFVLIDLAEKAVDTQKSIEAKTTKNPEVTEAKKTPKAINMAATKKTLKTTTKMDSIHKALLQKGIMARPVQGYGLPHCLRLTVGRPEENKAAIKALSEVWRSLERN